MPRNLDWKDYIPASGEAHAQIGLKGRFGGKSNMAYRRRFQKGGRRNTKFASYRTRSSNKWWFTYIGENGDGETPITWDIGAGNMNSPQVVVSIEGHNIAGGSVNARGSNEGFVRWIGRDGSIPVTYRATDDTDGTPADPSVLYNPWISLFYAWFKFKQDFSQTLPSNIVTQFGMQADQNLGLILQRKDIIRWGTVDVCRQFTRRETNQTVDGTTSSILLDNVPFVRPRSFIPFPRFPKAGFRVEPNDIIMCIVQPTNPVDYSAVPSTDYGTQVLRAFPLFRMLMAE